MSQGPRGSTDSSSAEVIMNRRIQQPASFRAAPASGTVLFDARFDAVPGASAVRTLPSASPPEPGAE